MASVMNVKESREFCDKVFVELSGMKKKILELESLSTAESPGRDVEGGMFKRHLSEIADQIEWKLQILAHSCPVDWKGSSEYEETAQVDTNEKSRDSGFSPGYVGG